MKERVLLIQNNDIKRLNISPSECIAWVDESFKNKYKSQLPAKISVHPQGNDFFTSMPALLPAEYGVFGIKEVSRILGRTPSLSSDIMLYDSNNGQLLAILDGDWITTMRTGAVAALSIKKLQNSSVDTYSFIGLGNTARATALCLIAEFKDKPITFRILKYKDQSASFMARLSMYQNVKFEEIDTTEGLIAGADVIISTITDASNLICEKDELYRQGVLLVPIHTRGFQNCDLFFDKIFGDDTDHIKGFKNFSKFKLFDEFSNILLGKSKGRENANERIIAYNIGLGLHDILFSYKIYDKLKDKQSASFKQEKETDKFWI